MFNKHFCVKNDIRILIELWKKKEREEIWRAYLLHIFTLMQN